MFDIEKLEDGPAKKISTEVTADMVKISLKSDSSKFCVMPQKYVDQDLERIKNMKIFEDDVWVVTYPKCGTTWTQEMIWMISNDLDYETSSKVQLSERFPFLEWSGIIKNFTIDTFAECENLSRPRYIKSHLPLFLLPDQLWTVKPKIIYVARNPKDTAVSWFHHHRHLHCYQGTKEDLVEAFVKDLMLYSPMNDHVLDFWKIRNEPNILFLFYEDMKRNLDQEVKRAMKFLGKDFSQKEIDKLCSHLSFDSIKDNKMINKIDEIRMLKESAGEKFDPNEFSFVRKGQVGGYKKELTTEENEMLDEYSKWSKFEEFDFEYRF